jgi:hypothetical protein
MTETALIIPDEIPAYIANPEAAKEINADAAAGISTGAPPRIKLAAKQFVLVDGNGDETPILAGDMVVAPDKNQYMGVIALGAKKEIQKAFYLEAYNPNEEGKEPDCFSNDGVTPDPSATAKQCESCAACPKNQWGSGTDQSGNATKGKACSDSKVIAVHVPGHGIHKLKMPPASLKNWGLFVKELSSKNIPVTHIKLLIGFDPSSEFSVLIFRYGGFLDEKAIGKVKELQQSDECKDVLEDRVTAALPAPPVTAAQDGKPEKPEKPQNIEEPAQTTVDDLGLGADTATQASEEPVDSGAEVSNEDLMAELGL